MLITALQEERKLYRSESFAYINKEQVSEK